MAAIRIRVADAPLERDEGEYAYSGQLILHGVPPYKLAYNMKLPGTYAAYAALMAVFGETARGIHLGMILVNGATVVLIFLIGRRLFDFIAGLVAAASMALLSISPAFLANAGHANHFVALFALAGLYVLLTSEEPKAGSRFFWSGLLLGLAFLMKQQGIVFIGFGVFTILWQAIRKGLVAWKSWLKPLTLLLAGGAVPFALTCLVLWSTGVFGKFWFWTFNYAREYATVVPTEQVIDIFLQSFSNVLRLTWVYWVLALIGINLLFVLKTSRSQAIWMVVFLIFSFAGTSIGFFFRPHYFLLTVPALCLLVGGFISQFRKLFPPKILFESIPVILFVVALGYSVYLHREYFFLLSPSQMNATTYRGNPFQETEAVARYIQENSSADDKVAVLGSEPEIYFLSKRRSATGYIYTYPLMEPQPFALKMQREMIQEVETAKPEFIVLMKVDFSWLVQQRSEQLILKWAGEYTAANYGIVGLIDYHDGQVEESWGPNAGTNPKGEEFIFVFRRRPN